MKNLLKTSILIGFMMIKSNAFAQEAAGIKVMLLFYESKSDLASRTGASAKGYWDSWSAYGKAMADAGIVRGGNVMKPGEAESVKVVSGKTKVEKKSYLDKKGELGGFFIIETKSLEAAEEWAAKAPNSKNGVTEIRVLPPMPGM